MEYTKSPPIVEEAQTWICNDMVESQHHEQTLLTQLRKCCSCLLYHYNVTQNY